MNAKLSKSTNVFFRTNNFCLGSKHGWANKSKLGWTLWMSNTIYWAILPTVCPRLHFMHLQANVTFFRLLSNTPVSWSIIGYSFFVSSKWIDSRYFQVHVKRATVMAILVHVTPTRVSARTASTTQRGWYSRKPINF